MESSPASRNAQAHATGDEVRVEICLAGGANQIGQIAPDKWFAAGEADLQHAKRGGFTYHALPFVGGQLMIVSGARRIGTVRAMQRAPIREFGEQCVWTGGNHVNSISLRW